MKRAIIYIILLISFFLFIIGIFEEDKTYSTFNNSTDLICSLDNIPSDLQKVTNLSKKEEDIICAISKGLISKSIDGTIMCDLAESYSVSEDGIEYIFHLRDDNKWSDGRDLSAKDIKDFFKELIKYEDEENISSLLSVYGAKEYKNGKGRFENDVAINSEGNTIKFRLNERNDNFLEELTKPQYRIRKSLPLWNDMDKYYSEIVYSGDYYIDNIEDNTIKLVSNKENTRIESILFIKDENEEKAMAAFELGKRDLIGDVSIKFINNISEEGKVVFYPANNAIYAFINNKNNIDIRKSLYMNLYKSLQEYLEDNNNYMELSEGCYYRYEKNNLDNIQNRKVAINSAKEDLPLETMSICSLDSEDNRNLCEYLVEWFKKEKNIPVKYKLISEEKFNEINKNNNYDIILINNDDKNNFISTINKFYDISAISINNGNSIEEKLFNNCIVAPLVFCNNNICLSSKSYNIIFDYNGNIIFNPN